MSTIMAREGKTNRHYLTLKSFVIDPRYLDDPGFALGSGVDLSDPLKPLLAPYTAFEPVFRVSATGEAGLPRSSQVIQEATTFRETRDTREEAQILSTFFKASYMLSSVELAYKSAQEEKEKYQTIYALLEHSGEQESLHESSRRWREVPASETAGDVDEALELFVSHYGSHYVSNILYGLRIAVQGKLQEKGMQKAGEMAATFKAAFGNFSAEGGARLEQRKKLEQMNVDLILEATSGGREGGGLLVARGLDEINEFLDGLKAERIHFRVAPIRLTLKPYFPTLDPGWALTRKALNPTTAAFTTPGAPYGVPKGTVIAWYPTADFIRGLDSAPELPTVVAPDGWAICDGTLGTPDLRARFVRGATGWSPTLHTGGGDSHDHGGATEGNTAFRGAHGGAGSAYKQPAEVHTHRINPASNLPPFAELLYIMKLEDRP
jgi:hypothetical protein